MQLYPYQIEAVNRTETNDKGILVLPTGTGKTMIQAEIIYRELLNNPNQFKMFVVNAPRIILTYQLLKEIATYLINKKVECRFHFTHSGSSIDIKDLENLRIEANNDGANIPFSEIESTTSSIKLVDVLKSTRELNVPIIIFSTYNSANRVEDARVKIDEPISITLNDEAHYLVQDRFYDIVEVLQSTKKYFFTATMRVNQSNEGRGMNNTNTYGEVLYEMKPRVAIEMGRMVRPRIHTIKTDNVRTDEDFDRSLNLVILNSIKQHKEHFENEHPQIVPKILISMRGSSDIKSFLESNEYNEIRGMNIDVFAISSVDEIGNDVNGEKVKRQDFLSELKKVGKDRNRMMVVLHYDILTEGIDVPGFTTCMPLRNLNKIRFIQTFGRCARLDERDRERLSSGEIVANDVNEWIKPYAYVVLPDITLTNKDDYENMKDMIDEIRQLDYQSFEDIVESRDALGIGEDEEPDVFNELTHNNKTLGQLIREVKSEFELEQIARLSWEEQFDRHIVF